MLIRRMAITVIGVLGTGAWTTPLTAQDARPAQAEAGGVFVGVDGHGAEGHYRLEYAEDRWTIHLEEDFRSDRVPDAYVVLGHQPDTIDESVLFVAKLERSKGAQSYQLPEGVDPGAFHYLLIWCRRFSVGIGAAPIATES